MQGPEYRFYITHQDETTVELLNLSTDKLSLKIEKEREEIFYRMKLNGSLVVAEKHSPEAYKFLLQIEQSNIRCSPLILGVHKKCSSEYKPHWSGLFTCNMGKWNIDQCIVRFDVSPDDKYRCIFERWDKELNLLNAPVSGEELGYNGKIVDPIDFEFSYIAAGANSIDALEADFIEGTGWKHVVTAFAGVWDVHYNQYPIRFYFREVAYTNVTETEGTPPGSGWIFTSQNNNVAKWERVPQIPVPGTVRQEGEGRRPGGGELVMWPLVSSQAGTEPPEFSNHDEVLFIVDPTYIQLPGGVNIADYRGFWNPAANRVKYKRNRYLMEAIEYLLGEICPDLIPENLNDMSMFFNDDINYVTGTPNALKNLQISQISDIKRPTSSESASKGEITLKKLLEDLRLIFNTYWHVNELGKLQIEHYSWFEKDTLTDLTEPQYSKWVNGKHSYEYLFPTIPKYEKWDMTGQNEDFVSSRIEYEGYCVDRENDENIKSYNPSLITDFKAVVTSPDDFPDKGFVLIASKDGLINAEMVPELGKVLPNGHLAIKNLTRNYHVFGRFLPFGILDGIETVFLMPKRYKKQSPIIIPYCCPDDDMIDFEGKFATVISPSGQLDSAEIRFKSNTIVLNLLHHIGEITEGEDGTEIDPIILRQFDDSFNESFK